MVRIEIHLDNTETDILDAIAKKDGRSRKNLCETEIRKLIKERGQKIKTATENVAFADNGAWLGDVAEPRT